MIQEELSIKAIQRYKNKSVPSLIKIAERHFNTYIRKRDSDGYFFTCISCAKLKSIRQMNAGHYLSAGHNGIVRFNENNVNGQCGSYCNRMLHGNLINYRIGLVKKIGEEKVKELEAMAKHPHKWDRFTLISIIEKYKKLC